MNISEKYRENIKKEYEKNIEETANRYTLRCMGIVMIILSIIWILDMLNIFMVDRKVTTIAYLMSLIVYFVGRIFLMLQGLSKPYIKYFIILWAVAMITILTTAFTFHAILACVVPIMYTSMYQSKRIMYFTFVLMIISTIVTVFVGYYWGICDANMTLLTGKPLRDYIMPDNTFALTQINDRVVWNLTLFFVIPRCMICILFTLICRSISNIISSNVKYTQKIEMMAEIDQMTGIYNKSKYLNMIEEQYKKEKNIAVIFWDINYLKEVNDTMGHEAGDFLIITIAKILKELTTDTDKAYRIGGDEYVMIMRGGDEKSVRKKVREWEKQLSQASKTSSIPLSASIGYAVGAGEDIEEVIRIADGMMYENKKRFHDKRKLE